MGKEDLQPLTPRRMAGSRVSKPVRRERASAPISSGNLRWSVKI